MWSHPYGFNWLYCIFYVSFDIGPPMQRVAFCFLITVFWSLSVNTLFSTRTLRYHSPTGQKLSYSPECRQIGLGCNTICYEPVVGVADAVASAGLSPVARRRNCGRAGVPANWKQSGHTLAGRLVNCFAPAGVRKGKLLSSLRTYYYGTYFSPCMNALQNRVLIIIIYYQGILYT